MTDRIRIVSHHRPRVTIRHVRRTIEKVHRTARQKRYRDGRRDGMPTDDDLHREVSRVVFANVGNRAFSATDAISQARSRLLQRYSFDGINRVIVRLGERA